ncbi:hypothetical protein V8E53_000321 [Lactarius tabidus]
MYASWAATIALAWRLRSPTAAPSPFASYLAHNLFAFSLLSNNAKPRYKSHISSLVSLAHSRPSVLPFCFASSIPADMVSLISMLSKDRRPLGYIIADINRATTRMGSRRKGSSPLDTGPVTPKFYQVEDLLDKQIVTVLTNSRPPHYASRLGLRFPLQSFHRWTAITFGFTFHLTDHAMLEENREGHTFVAISASRPHQESR